MFTPDIKDDKVKWAQTSSTFDNDEISKAIVAKISTVVSGLAWQNKLNNISFDTVVLWGLETQPWWKSIQLPQRRETIKFHMPSDIFPFLSGRNVFFIAWFWNFKQRVPQLLLNILSVAWMNLDMPSREPRMTFNWQTTVPSYSIPFIKVAGTNANSEVEG
jgi:hypothetical protein